MARWLVTITKTATVLVEAPTADLAESGVGRRDYDYCYDYDVEACEAKPDDDPEDDGPDLYIDDEGESYTPPDPPLGEPGAGKWLPFGGHEWATDGWCIFRRDGPRPADGYAGRGEWRSASLDHDTAAKVLTPGAVVLRLDGDGPRVGVYAGAEPTIPTLRLVGDGRVTYVRRDFAPIVQAGELRQGEPLGPITVSRGGDVVAAVMPICVEVG